MRGIYFRQKFARKLQGIPPKPTQICDEFFRNLFQFLSKIENGVEGCNLGFCFIFGGLIYILCIWFSDKLFNVKICLNLPENLVDVH